MMLAVDAACPSWTRLAVHESSPARRGLSLRLLRECKGLVATQYLSDTPRGQRNRAGFRSENLERQTFADETFDLVVTQDVFEHLFQPDLATAEIWRTLKPGGYHIFTTPIYKGLATSERRATLRGGKVEHLAPQEFHSNPVDPEGSLVTFHYGADFADLLRSWARFEVEIMTFEDRLHGILGEFMEVVVCRKPSGSA